MRQVQLQVRQYPKLIEEFAKENFNLKTLVGALIALMLVNSVILAFLLRRGPMVVPLQADGNTARVDSHVTEAQVQAAVKEYLSTRYTWTDSTINAQLKRAEFFISSQLVSAFQKAMVETAKYVREKKVVQRVYARSIDVNFKDRVATIAADRFTEFDGLKAATEMRLLLNFDLQDRTVINPWGVYITKETEKALQ
jgi:hypothetical protein